jgi:hypothetical protein
MTPSEICLTILYCGDKAAFTADLDGHLQYGYVHSTPEVFTMARPVCSWWSLGQIEDVTQVPHPRDADAWLIWQLTGSLQEAVKLFPFPLTYIGAGRKGSLRFYEFERFMRLT